MGNALSWQNVGEGMRNPDTTPRTGSMPTFDPHEGFDYQRKPREKKFNDAEMEALRVPPKFRDYCAHLWVPFADCKNKNWPWSYRCAHESHAIVMCQARDQEHRVREWERERRLRIRQKEETGAFQGEQWKPDRLRG